MIDVNFSQYSLKFFETLKRQYASKNIKKRQLTSKKVKDVKKHHVRRVKSIDVK